MDGQLKQLYSQLTGPNLSLDQKKQLLNAVLLTSADDASEQTCKQMMLFYDRILKARYEPFEEILSQAASKWGRCVGQTASLNEKAPISSVMLWVMERICQVTNERTLRILLAITQGLVEGDDTLKANQFIPSLTSILLSLNMKAIKTDKLETIFMDTWDILANRYPGTIRTLLPVHFLRLCKFTIIRIWRFA